MLGKIKIVLHGLPTVLVIRTCVSHPYCSWNLEYYRFDDILCSFNFLSNQAPEINNKSPLLRNFWDFIEFSDGLGVGRVRLSSYLNIWYETLTYLTWQYDFLSSCHEVPAVVGTEQSMFPDAATYKIILDSAFQCLIYDKPSNIPYPTSSPFLAVSVIDGRSNLFL